MDTSRLLAVIDDIESDNSDGLSNLLSELVQQYTAARDAPGQDNTPAILKARAALVDHINESVFAKYPPSKNAVLEAIGGHNRVGPGLLDRLSTILSVTGQTTAGIVTGLTQLQQDLQTFLKACIQTKSGVLKLGITPHIIPENTFEVGVLIPERLVGQKLGPLTKELEQWNAIVRVFQEVAGEDQREVTIAGLSSGSYEIYLPLGFTAAYLVARTIDKVVEWYLKILEIRKRRLELQQLGAPTAEGDEVKKYERKLLDEEITQLANAFITQSQKSIPASRKQELETHLTISIRHIARFVDKGGSVGIDSTPPEEPNEPAPPTDSDASPEKNQQYEHAKDGFVKLKADYEKVFSVLVAGSSIGRLPERTEPILQLTDGEAESEPIEPEKTSKKKS